MVELYNPGQLKLFVNATSWMRTFKRRKVDERNVSSRVILYIYTLCYLCINSLIFNNNIIIIIFFFYIIKEIISLKMFKKFKVYILLLSSYFLKYRS